MFEKTLVEFAALLGFATLVPVIINILKTFGVVKEDTAQTWSAGINLIGLLALYGLRLFRPEFSVEGIDAVFLEVATVGTYILGFMSQLGISKLTHFCACNVGAVTVVSPVLSSFPPYAPSAPKSIT